MRHAVRYALGACALLAAVPAAAKDLNAAALAGEWSDTGAEGCSLPFLSMVERSRSARGEDALHAYIISRDTSDEGDVVLGGARQGEFVNRYTGESSYRLTAQGDGLRFEPLTGSLAATTLTLCPQSRPKALPTVEELSAAAQRRETVMATLLTGHWYTLTSRGEPLRSQFSPGLAACALPLQGKKGGDLSFRRGAAGWEIARLGGDFAPQPFSEHVVGDRKVFRFGTIEIRLAPPGPGQARRIEAREGRSDFETLQKCG